MKGFDYNRFFVAAENGENALLTHMLSEGYNVHANNDLALRCASENGKIETVKLLLKKGAFINALDSASLRWAAYYGETEVVDFLIKSGADLHACADSALCNAIVCNHYETVQCILSHSNTTYSSDSYPVRLAKKKSHINIIRLFTLETA